MLRFAPVHLKTRPCRHADAAGGGPRTWRPSAVTCEECRPAAVWLGDKAGAIGLAVTLPALIFALCLL